MPPTVGFMTAVRKTPEADASRLFNFAEAIQSLRLGDPAQDAAEVPALAAEVAKKPDRFGSAPY
jgi:hypothetical protein